MKIKFGNFEIVLDEGGMFTIVVVVGIIAMVVGGIFGK